MFRSRGEKILNAVVIPPPESDIGESSDEEPEFNHFNDSDNESEAPSVDSAMRELMDELSGNESEDELSIIEITPMKTPVKPTYTPEKEPNSNMVMKSKKIVPFSTRMEIFLDQTTNKISTSNIHQKDSEIEKSDFSPDLVPNETNIQIHDTLQQSPEGRVAENEDISCVQVSSTQSIKKAQLVKKKDQKKLSHRKMTTCQSARSKKKKNAACQSSRSLRKITTRQSAQKLKQKKNPTPRCTRTSKKMINTPVSTCNLKKEKTAKKGNLEISIKKVKPAVKKRLKMKWEKIDFWHDVDIEETKLHAFDGEFYPIDFFNMFFDNKCIDLIVEQTNLYSVQQNSRSVNTNASEIQDFIGIQLLMGIIQMSCYRDYWGEKLRYDKIANVMSLKRYETLRSRLHFVNNDDSHLYETDRFYKIRPISEIIRQNCLRVEHETKFSVDEMMIPYKGTKAGSRRQYIKNKPKKWGFKFFVRAGISGIVYDFFPYAGETTFVGCNFTEFEETYFGMGSKVVTTLCKTIPNPRLCVIFYDNWFSSVELAYYMRKNYGILTTGTIMANRLRNCPLISDKLLKKKKRGTFDYHSDNSKKITVVKWLDNKCVNLISTVTGVHPLEEVKRFSKADKKKVPVPCPKVVKDYNQHMGGVDLADMLIALYRTNMRTHRWYFSIFSQLLDICVNNGWLLYRRNQNLKNLDPKTIIKLKDFRFEIATSLINKGKVKPGRPMNIDEHCGKRRGDLTAKKSKKNSPKLPHPSANVRLDNVDHFPITTELGRCRCCRKKRTTFKCSKCDLRLCLVKNSNCFLQYHKVKNLNI